MGVFLLLDYEMALVVGHHRRYPGLIIVTRRYTMIHHPIRANVLKRKDLASVQAIITQSYSTESSFDSNVRLHPPTSGYILDRSIRIGVANCGAHSREEFRQHELYPNLQPYAEVNCTNHRSSIIPETRLSVHVAHCRNPVDIIVAPQLRLKDQVPTKLLVRSP
jgi:hypothetical protein